MRKPIRKVAAALGLSACLTLSMGAGVAFAAGNGTSNTGTTTSWDVPTSPMTNTVTKDGTLYKVITTWCNAWASNGPDYLGISNSAYVQGNGGATFTFNEQALNNTLAGVWGTNVNESPNAFMWNTFYNYYADNNALDKTDLTVVNNQWDTTAGVYQTLKYRPEIVSMSNGFSLDTSPTVTDAVSLIQQGKYINGLDVQTSTSIDPRSGKEQTTTTETPESYAVNTSSYYVNGDENYDPYYFVSGNGAPMRYITTFYTLAADAEQIIEDTADYNADGAVTADNVTWKTMNDLPRATRYNESATECALNVEKTMKGGLYYVLDQINAGNVSKKKVAFIASNPATGQNTVQVVAYDYTEQIGGGKLSGAASYAPLAVDSLTTSDVAAERVANSNTGGANLSGAKYGQASQDLPYTVYNATAADLLDCDYIYAPGTVNAQSWNTWLVENAGEEAVTASDVEIITGTPTVMQTSNFTAEKLIYGVYAVNSFYPELFPNYELMAYWYDNVYHLNTDKVGTVLNWAFAVATATEGNSLSEVDSTYSKTDMESKFAAGLTYYTENQFTDPTISRVMNGKDLDGNSGWNFTDFAPSEYWSAQYVPSGEETSTGAEAFVERLYTLVLNREPDAEGIAAQVAGMKTMGAAQIAYNFFTSDEFTSMALSNPEQVEKAYTTLLGRYSDADGKAMWTEYLDNGMSIASIVKGFAQSDEFNALCDEWGVEAGTIFSTLEARDQNPGVTAFASRMYTVVLSRDAEIDGLNVQCQALIDGTPCYQIAYNFFNSKEFADHGYTNEEIVRIAYAALLGRDQAAIDADTEGIAYWVDRLEKNGLEDVIKGFCQSDEFEAICQDCGMTSGMR